MPRLSRATFVLLATAAVIAPTTGAVVHRATLRIVRTTPTVGVVLTHDGSHTARVVRASQTGSFAASFPAIVPFDPCSDSFVVVAAGARGDSASVKFVPRECPPAP